MADLDFDIGAKDFTVEPRKLNVSWAIETMAIMENFLRPKYFPLEIELSVEEQIVKYASREIKQSIDAAALAQILPNRKKKKV